MRDYEALDLTLEYNAKPGIYQSVAEPPLGNQLFHGLPFKIGDGNPDTHSFIGFGAELRCPMDPIRIQIGRPAINLIFAHTEITSEISAGLDGRGYKIGDNPGSPVATYKFRWADGNVDPRAIIYGHGATRGLFNLSPQ